jgi:hypothetical protein
MTKSASPAFLTLIALLFPPLSSHASCGVSFCAMDSQWDGPAFGGGSRLDLRLEYINQNQPMHAREKVSVGAIRQHHDEVRTINRNLLLGVDHDLGQQWRLAWQVPVVSRSHDHIHNHHGAVIPRAWDFEAAGDVRVLLQRRLGVAGDATPGVAAGLKLPTGTFKQRNDVGALAERSLQPGTGTTDLIVGAFYHARLLTGTRPLSWFAQAFYQAPLNNRDDYAPGFRLSADTGVAMPLSHDWEGVIQLNAQVRGRDQGSEAEPRDTGGSFLWLSPGLGWKVNRQSQFYGFVQLPLYQRVNGVQLTAPWAAALGYRHQF